MSCKRPPRRRIHRNLALNRLWESSIDQILCDDLYPNIVRTSSTQLDVLRQQIGARRIDDLNEPFTFKTGTVHELLCDSHESLTPAVWIVQSVLKDDNRAIIWSDPRNELYPPALAAMGIPLHRLLTLHPTSPADEVWAITQCMRCPAVCATIASINKLSKIEARRLQLAAERGGGIGILLRSSGKFSANYAAASRWRVSPARGDPVTQRWNLQNIHGHGGHIVLEVDRETLRVRKTNSVSASEALADRSASTQTG